MTTKIEYSTVQLAAAANVKNRWNGVMYNVLDNGLVGGGVTNDTAALQTLINTAIAAGRKNILFPHNTYYVTALTNADQVNFIGDNSSFVGGYTGTISDIGGLAALEAETVTGIVNAVTGFGADPTGFADSSAAIQAAINSNTSFIAVYLPPGDYKLSSSLVINRQNLLLFGAGRATTLLPDAGVTGINVATLNGVSNTKISNLRIYGKTNAVGGIALGDGGFTAFTSLEDLSIENFATVGSFGIKMAKVQELDIHNCYIADNYNCLTAPVGTGNYVTSAHIHGQSGYIGRAVNLGILLDIPVASFKVSDIVVESNVGGGIASLGKGSQIIIDGVHFEANGGANAIYVSGTALGKAKLTLRNSFFFGNAGCDLRTDYLTSSVVEDNGGLIGTGRIITTANSEMHLASNRIEDIALNQDAITMYETLLGNISYYETNTLGTRIQRENGVKTFRGTAAPTSLAWKQGDRCVNSAPAVGSPKAWACTVAGTPGTWVSEGNL